MCPRKGLSGRGSCLGCTMLYSYLAIEHSEPQAYAQAISQRWAQRQRDGFQINGIDEFTLDFREDGQKNLSLAEELAGPGNSGVVSDAAFGGALRL